MLTFHVSPFGKYKEGEENGLFLGQVLYFALRMHAVDFQ